MTAFTSGFFGTSRFFALAAGTLVLSGCASLPSHEAEKTPPPVTPTEQYALESQSLTKSISLRINSQGLSDNQRRALDQVAAQSNWMSGEPVDVQIITSGDPQSVAAGERIGVYLMDHDVARETLSQASLPEQPGDIVTVNTVYYRGHVYDCGKAWENLAATGGNKTYKNFGCAVTSNLAAQVADPRDLNHPTAATPAEAGRKATILDKYRKGDVTAATPDDNSKGNVSSAIK